MRNVILVMIIGFMGSISAAQKWTEWREVGMFYTYTKADSLYVHLEGERCPNEKAYYTIDSERNPNAKQTISMILAASAMKRKVRILTDPEQSTVMCYVLGLQVSS
ncbi:hypothetical protein [Pleionea litopenaei]|uniref:Uncharacterized protein n=1 Tax=Pleionea litopenaei TaxID=3070815 RepID=A0AA51RU17_9GAMM|nr:hypothetical protein [Pleionea sp. HL-JVS1]WMS87499.1 hypothetical protein Q9312_00880 [Pleionea sp. HL-JVS1]